MRKGKSKSLALCMLFLLGFCLAEMHAQEAISPMGGNASGNGGSMSYTLGQLACQTHWAKNAYLTEGVQQPYEISVITGVEEASAISLSLKAYPNPASTQLTLEVPDFQSGLMAYALYDLSGRCLRNNTLTESLSIINMRALPAGAYFLKVTDGSKELKTFKIIKN